MKCPLCSLDGFVELKDEVDIGVGTQTRVYGGECRQCGEISMCSDCGSWQPLNGERHTRWCKYFVGGSNG